MENIVLIKGKVQFTITLDPSVWIFDDRRIDLDTFFVNEEKIENELETYTKSISEHWDREIREGAVYPPTLITEKKYEKEKMLTGSFGILLEPFITNAQPLHTVKNIIIETVKDEITLPFTAVSNLIAAFSNKGKPLVEDGPIHIYFRDGSNQDKPIINVKAFRLE